MLEVYNETATRVWAHSFAYVTLKKYVWDYISTTITAFWKKKIPSSQCCIGKRRLITSFQDSLFLDPLIQGAFSPQEQEEQRESQGFYVTLHTQNISDVPKNQTSLWMARANHSCLQDPHNSAALRFQQHSHLAAQHWKSWHPGEITVMHLNDSDASDKKNKVVDDFPQLLATIRSRSEPDFPPQKHTNYKGTYTYVARSNIHDGTCKWQRFPNTFSP